MTQKQPGNIPANKNNPIFLRRAFTAAVVSVVLSLIAILLFSLLVKIGLFPESFIPALMMIITIAGGFFSGYLTALSVPSMGLINGLSSGAFYFLLMYIISAILAPGFAINKTTLTNIILSVLSAGIGGILSINLKASRKNRKRRAKSR